MVFGWRVRGQGKMGPVGLTVAVTGPTGEIGISAVTALEQSPAVDRIVGMARRPFDPSALGWTKTTYQQGDILDRQAVNELVADADVVIHLAFIIMGSREESARVNLAGTRNVFEATVSARRPGRLVFTSSVAAYGYHSDNPVPLTEDVPPRGSPEHYYSEQKAACEAELARSPRDRRWRCSSFARASSRGPRRPHWLTRCHGGTCRGRCSRAPARSPFSRRPSPTRAFRFSSCTMTTSPPRSRWPRPPIAPPGVYNIAGDGEVSISEVVDGAGRPPGAGTGRRRDRRVGRHRAPAVRSVGPGVAARRAGVGRDGHQQGKVAVGLEAEVHVGGNAARPREGYLTL